MEILLTSKDNIHIGDLVRRLWKNYCRRCNASDLPPYHLAYNNAKNKEKVKVKSFNNE